MKEEKNIEKPETTEEQEVQLNLYEKQLEQFRKLVAENLEEALDIYGIWQVHSLTPEEKMELFERLGFSPRQAQEFYNLGLRSARQGDYKQAEAYFKKSLEENPDFNEAIYNLALTYEHLGNIKKSIDLWQLYQERIGSRHPDYSTVRSHIRTLKKKIE